MPQRENAFIWFGLWQPIAAIAQNSPAVSFLATAHDDVVGGAAQRGLSGV